MTGQCSRSRPVDACLLDDYRGSEPAASTGRFSKPRWSATL